MLGCIEYIKVRATRKFVVYTLATQKFDHLSHPRHLIYNCSTRKVLVHLDHLHIDCN